MCRNAYKYLVTLYFLSIHVERSRKKSTNWCIKFHQNGGNEGPVRLMWEDLQTPHQIYVPGA